MSTLNLDAMTEKLKLEYRSALLSDIAQAEKVSDYRSLLDFARTTDQERTPRDSARLLEK